MFQKRTFIGLGATVVALLAISSSSAFAWGGLHTPQKPNPSIHQPNIDVPAQLSGYDSFTEGAVSTPDDDNHRGRGNGNKKNSHNDNGSGINSVTGGVSSYQYQEMADNVIQNVNKKSQAGLYVAPTTNDKITVKQDSADTIGELLTTTTDGWFVQHGAYKDTDKFRESLVEGVRGMVAKAGGRVDVVYEYYTTILNKNVSFEDKRVVVHSGRTATGFSPSSLSLLAKDTKLRKVYMISGLKKDIKWQIMGTELRPLKKGGKYIFDVARNSHTLHKSDYGIGINRISVTSKMNYYPSGGTIVYDRYVKNTHFSSNTYFIKRVPLHKYTPTSNYDIKYTYQIQP